MEGSTGIRRRVTGSPFQVAGPATEKARHCLVAVLERGTISSAAALNLRLAWWSNRAHSSMKGLGPQCHGDKRRMIRIIGNNDFDSIRSASVNSWTRSSLLTNNILLNN